MVNGNLWDDTPTKTLLHLVGLTLVTGQAILCPVVDVYAAGKIALHHITLPGSTYSPMVCKRVIRIAGEYIEQLKQCRTTNRCINHNLDVRPTHGCTSSPGKTTVLLYPRAVGLCGPGVVTIRTALT